MRTPYIGFYTVDNQPKLGPTARCPRCGKECKVKDSDPPMLQFVDCCGTSFLVGIEGHDISGVRPDVSGSIDLEEVRD